MLARVGQDQDFVSGSQPHILGDRGELAVSYDEADPGVRRQSGYLADGAAVGAGHWWFRFSVMLALSVVIAVLGLSLDSDAVVIGAMLVAPLMTPLMTPLIGTAAALVMG